MNMKHFNLVEDPWIPTNLGLLSLRELFQADQPVYLQGAAHDRFCILRLLIAICQAACDLEEEADWHSLDDDTMKQRVLAYLEEKKALFDLYDPERPFLQYPGIVSKSPLPVAAFVPGVCAGNNTVLFDSNRLVQLDDAAKARVLLFLCITPFSGKRIDPTIILSPGFVKGKSAPVAPAMDRRGTLHTYALGATLFETIRLALLTEELRDGMDYVDEIGIPPWENMPRENDAMAQRLKRSVFGRLIPMARFCRLDGDIIHVTSGVPMPLGSSGQTDFSQTVRRAIDPKTKGYRLLEARVLMQPWRQLNALLDFCLRDKSEWQCRNLEWASSRTSLRGLWCFGIQVTSQSGEQYFSAQDGVVDSEIYFSKEFQLKVFYQRYISEMDLLSKVSQRLWGAVSNYYKECSATDLASKIAKKAQEKFWSKIGIYSESFLRTCEKGELDHFHKEVCRVAISVYDEVCEKQTARQLFVWSHCRPSFIAIYEKK